MKEIRYIRKLLRPIVISICDINFITSKNVPNFKENVFVLHDMGDKLNKDIGYYFTEGRHNNIQMIVMCHNQPR